MLAARKIIVTILISFISLIMGDTLVFNRIVFADRYKEHKAGDILIKPTSLLKGDDILLGEKTYSEYMIKNIRGTIMSLILFFVLFNSFIFDERIKQKHPNKPNKRTVSKPSWLPFPNNAFTITHNSSNI